LILILQLLVYCGLCTKNFIQEYVFFVPGTISYKPVDGISLNLCTEVPSSYFCMCAKVDYVT